MFRRLLPLLLLGGIALPCSGQEGTVIDAVIRYVNGAMISHADLLRRVQDMEATARARGMTRPSSIERRRQLWAIALQDATAELLLEQEAARLQIPIDTRQIRRDIQIEVVKEGKWPTLAEQRQELDRRKRRRLMRTLEGFFFAKLPSITPAELVKAYEANIDKLRQPAQARVFRIVMIPSNADDLTRTANTMADLCFDVLADAGDAKLAATVTDAIRQGYLDAADAPAQCTALAPALRAGLDLLPVDGSRTQRALRKQLAEALAGWDGFRTSEQINQDLDGLRRRLNSVFDGPQRLAMFAQAAADMSHVPKERKARGDLGIVQPGRLGEGYDEPIFALRNHEVSQVFQVGDAWCLAMVDDKTEGRVPSLDEARARLRQALEDAQRERARAVLLKQLTDKAVIRDVAAVDVDRLLGRTPAP